MLMSYPWGFFVRVAEDKMRKRLKENFGDKWLRGKIIPRPIYLCGKWYISWNWSFSQQDSSGRGHILLLTISIPAHNLKEAETLHAVMLVLLFNFEQHECKLHKCKWVTHSQMGQKLLVQRNGSSWKVLVDGKVLQGIEALGRWQGQ